MIRLDSDDETDGEASDEDPFEKPTAFPDFDHAGIVLMPSGAGKSHFVQHLPIELKARVVDGDALVDWARKPGSGITAAQHLSLIHI